MPPSAGPYVLPDGFTLVRRLGEGGFGEVWQGTAPGGIPVALKFLQVQSPQLDVELRALDSIKSLRHAHLLALLGVWKLPTSVMIAMELAEGTLLDRARQCANGVIPRDELLEYMRQAADALDFLNGKGVQHRDVKPQNLLLVPGGLKVGDFGLAKLLEHTVTAASGRMTPAYSAPEFFNNQASAWSDQYSLAVTYCHLRSGRLPFGGNAAQILAGHLTRPPDLSLLPAPEWPALTKALAKDPRQRWPTCRALVEELRKAAAPVARVNAPVQHADQVTAQSVPTLLEPSAALPPPPGRRRLLAVALLGLLALSLAGVGLAVWAADDMERPTLGGVLQRIVQVLRSR